MALTVPFTPDPGAIEALLRDDLAHADQVMIHMGPILQHLLRNDDNSIFSDEIIARVRGMLSDLARQLVQAVGQAAGHDNSAAWAREASDGLADMLAGNQALLNHLHMLAVEWQLTEKVQGRLGLDPVLTPLLQDIIASRDPDLAARGMNLLAAQARFGQLMRRMQIPLSELPGDLHHIALMTMQAYVAEDPSGLAAAGAAESTLRQQRMTAASRLELLDHVIGQLAGDSGCGLKIDTAGIALFLSTLASGAGMSREMAIMCTTESQMARMALALSAAGADRTNLVTTFAALHPQTSLPDGIDQIVPDAAAAMLASSLMRREAFG
ncbi:hypothetical protein [Novosphingobium subterraneum]|uniref:Uncharacterized protein n=1 Tax=Novosphingobium subterraneum TaxID=48936 RepID=A0A0B9AI50_9SPHN|nr:hypothetical protein [Novosphingobium subterraneum]KHS48988.1 hypothetical protein NJ75_00420 [Novosphingobium subterraneum]